MADRAEPEVGRRALRRGERGFSLIEVVLAMLILGGAIVTLLEIQDRGIDQATRSRNLRFARMLAQEQLESVVLGLEEGSGGESETYPGLSWSRANDERTVIGDRKVLRVKVTVRFPDPARPDGNETSLVSYVDPAEQEEGGGRGVRR